MMNRSLRKYKYVFFFLMVSHFEKSKLPVSMKGSQLKNKESVVVWLMLKIIWNAGNYCKMKLFYECRENEIYPRNFTTDSTDIRVWIAP